MKRTAYKKMLQWKMSKRRKPLLVQGARQVGKTYLIQEFGKQEYQHFWYLNFEQNPDLKSLFSETLNPVQIIENLSLFLGHKIKATNTLIFFDEIQNAPNALTSLKYFHESASEFHIIAAGSLLGVQVAKEQSFPVGKVNFMNLYPMSFYEFLLAQDEQQLADYITSKTDFNPIPTALHTKLLQLTKKYMFLGGMPEVIQTYLDTNDISQARQIQNDILEAYSRDFSKYASKQETIRITQVWRSIPYQLAKENKKFMYQGIQKKARSSQFEQAIAWLQNAGLILIINNISTAKLPLSGYANLAKFKIYLLDCGLLGALLQLAPKTIVLGDSLFSDYNGAFTENFVATELTAYGHSKLFYWTSNNKAEVDFVIQKSQSIIPIEVKSGLGKNLKSLRVFQQKYQSDTIYRISPRNYTQADDFINLPFYGVKAFNHSS